MSSPISVERGVEIISNGKRDVLVYDGRWGPSVIRGGSGGSFAVMWGVQKNRSGEGEDVELSPASTLYESKVAEILEESISSGIDIEVVDPDGATRNPWVYNLLEDG